MASKAEVIAVFQALGIPLPAVWPENTDDGYPLLLSSWILFGISTVFLAGRYWSKIAILKRFSLDDWLMLLAWAETLVYSISLQVGYHHGLGRHYMYIGPGESLNVLKWAYVAQVFTILGPMLARVSFNLYLIALLGKARSKLRWPLWALVATQIIFNHTLIFVLWADCGFNLRVISNFHTTCFKQGSASNLAHFVAAYNAFTDLVLTIAPVLIVKDLRTTRRAKIAASLLLGLSLFAMAAAIWRTVEVGAIFIASYDFTHNVIAYFHASTVELNIILITTAVPTLGPLVNQLRQGRASPKNQSEGTTVSGSMSRQPSSDSHEVQYNLIEALGIRMPGLGNHVTIEGGGPRRPVSQEDMLSLTAMPAIKATRRTDIKVEQMDVEAEKMFTMHATPASERDD